MALVRSRRVRDAGMGRLVQQPATPGAHRQHTAGRSRATLLRHAGRTSHGSMTQIKWPPTNPGRFSGSFYMLQIYDRVLPSRSVPTLVALSVLAASLYVGQAALDFFRGRIL